MHSQTLTNAGLPVSPLAKFLAPMQNSSRYPPKSGRPADEPRVRAVLFEFIYLMYRCREFWAIRVETTLHRKNARGECGKRSVHFGAFACGVFQRQPCHIQCIFSREGRIAMLGVSGDVFLLRRIKRSCLLSYLELAGWGLVRLREKKGRPLWLRS